MHGTQGSVKRSQNQGRSSGRAHGNSDIMAAAFNNSTILEGPLKSVDQTQM
jgi:hypothetical protein